MSQLALPAARRGLMFVLSSPSGAGKTTLSRGMLGLEPGIALSISVTTRKMRPGEREGVDYHFVDNAEFDRMVKAGELLEHATVFDHRYGTPKNQVLAALGSGRDVLFDIDWQGTRQLAERVRGDLVSVFILPPSIEELERRLRQRAQDTEAVVQKRMAKAAQEISHWEEYDYVVVNNDVESTLGLIQKILHAERFKRERQVELAAFVDALCVPR